MKRKSLEGDQCPVARSLDVIGDWWSLLIVRDALAGMTRFGDFQRHLGIAKNILAIRLKTMVAQGIFTTSPQGEGTGHSEYLLTAKGKALMPVLITLAQWGDTYTHPDTGSGSEMVDALNLRPLKQVVLEAEDGRILGPDDIVAKLPSVPGASRR